MHQSPVLDSDPVRVTSVVRVRRIRRLSGAMVFLCQSMPLLLVGGLLFYWFATPAVKLLLSAGLSPVAADTIGSGTRLAGFAISMVPLSVLIWGLLQAQRCFRAFAAARFLTAEPVAGLRGFALGLLISSLVNPFATAALSVLLSWRGPPGTRTLTFNVGSDTLLLILFAGTIAVIAWVLAEAVAIAEENAQFV